MFPAILFLMILAASFGKVLAVLFLAILAVGFGKMLAIAIICLVAGFGVGRIKNSVKLAKIKDELGSAEKYVSSEARSLYSAIKSHL